MLSRLKSGAKAVGQKQTLRAVRDGRAAVVFLAEDAAEKITAPVEELCARQNVELQRVPTMKELGSACGIAIGAAAAAALK